MYTLHIILERRKASAPSYGAVVAMEEEEQDIAHASESIELQVN